MTIKSSQNLVEEALKEINTISPEDALKKINDNKCNLIDIRDIRELQNSGKVENSIHIPRGMLEFWMDMGFEKVSHIDGGFGAMKNKGFKIT